MRFQGASFVHGNANRTVSTLFSSSFNLLKPQNVGGVTIGIDVYAWNKIVTEINLISRSLVSFAVVYSV